MSTTKQPISWSSVPSADASAAELLTKVSSLSINHGFSFKQGSIYKYESIVLHLIFSALPGIPMRAKYGIFNDQGEQLFSAFEGI
jgi:hypothetical protein